MIDARVEAVHPLHTNRKVKQTMAQSENGSEPVKGPASYFPSIEKTYGQPMAHWFALVAARKGEKHAETVRWLKQNHAMGHGHANAIVAHCRAVDAG
jgi:Domain of unknown function (DUF4287)